MAFPGSKFQTFCGGGGERECPRTPRIIRGIGMSHGQGMRLDPRLYAVILALPISLLLNASYKQQRLPSIWKLANVSPLPKVKMVQDLKKELRPISLTPNISKVAEHFVVKDYVKPAVLKKFDPTEQFLNHRRYLLFLAWCTTGPRGLTVPVLQLE